MPDTVSDGIIRELALTEFRDEGKFWRAFVDAKPGILGGVFEILSRAIYEVKTIGLHNGFRLQDFVRWGCAIAKALGYKSEDFIAIEHLWKIHIPFRKIDLMRYKE